MSTAGTYFGLHTIHAFDGILPTAVCFVLASIFSAFCRVIFIGTSIIKEIKFNAMEKLRSKLPVIHLTPAQTCKNVTHIHIYNV